MRQRFLLLFHPRSGSNLITTALADHPAVVMYNELFHHIEVVRRDIRLPGEGAGPCSRTDYYHDGRDPVAFLQEQLYGRDFPPDKTAAGFKLSYFQMRSQANRGFCELLGAPAGLANEGEHEDRLWNWLGADREIRVISVYRRSLLQALVSSLNAVKSNQWWLPANASAKPAAGQRFQVPVEKFRTFVDLMVAGRERACALFADHALLSLEYQEDVVDQYDITMRRIEEFLGVAPLAVRPQLQKQARIPVSEAVVNYAELCQALAGTRYEAYL